MYSRVSILSTTTFGLWLFHWNNASKFSSLSCYLHFLSFCIFLSGGMQTLPGWQKHSQAISLMATVRQSSSSISPRPLQAQDQPICHHQKRTPAAIQIRSWLGFRTSYAKALFSHLAANGCNFKCDKIWLSLQNGFWPYFSTNSCPDSSTQNFYKVSTQTSLFLSVEASCQVWRHGHRPIIARLWKLENTYSDLQVPMEANQTKSSKQWDYKKVEYPYSLQNAKVLYWHKLENIPATSGPSSFFVLHSNLVNWIPQKNAKDPFNTLWGLFYMQENVNQASQSLRPLLKTAPGSQCYVRGKASKQSSSLWETNYADPNKHVRTELMYWQNLKEIISG